MFTKQKKLEEKKVEPVIPNKMEQFPANNVPPRGAKFYAAVPSPASQWWDVWGITVTEAGDLEAKLVSERLAYDLARIECGRRVIDAQMEYVK